jgi:hypothetical protein
VKAALLVLGLAACGADIIVIVPQIDSPDEADTDASVLADLVRIDVAVERISGANVASGSFRRGDTIEIAGVEFFDDLLIRIDGFDDLTGIAAGRTCTFALRANERPTPHLFLSRVGKMAAMTITSQSRVGGAGALSPDETVLLIGGDNLDTLERFDPRTNTIEPIEHDPIDVRTGAAISAFAPLGRIAIIGGLVDGSASTRVELVAPDGRVDEILDPAGIVGRAGVVATALTDGRILVTGGTLAGGIAASLQVALIVALSDGNEIQPQPTPLSRARTGHTATRLGDNDGAPVLLVGGINGNVTVPTTELYKSLNDTLVPLESPKFDLKTERFGHSAVLFADGSVVIFGGLDATGAPVRQIERFSLIDGLQPIGTLPDDVGVIELGIAKLSDTRFMVVGGRNAPGDSPLTGVHAISFDPNTDTISVGSLGDRLVAGRANPQVTVLCDGSVLISGGTDGDSVIERFNPNPRPL